MRSWWCLTGFALLAVVSAPVAGSARPPNAWSPRGPGGGGAMFAPALNPADPDELYVACDMSEQLHSTDGGRMWSLVDFREFQGGHESTVRFTRDPKIRWSLNYLPRHGGTTVLPVKTTDGGKIWRSLPDSAWPESRQAYVLYADYANPDRVLVSADYRELWMTRDSGKSFQQVLRFADSEAGLHLAGAFFDGDIIYAGTDEGMYVSMDGGRSFAKSGMPGLPAGEFISSFAGAKQNGKVRLYCVTHRVGWAGIYGADCRGFTGIYVLDVGEAAWMKRTTGLSETARPFYVALAANDIGTAYVAGGQDYPKSGPCIFRTTDGGQTWNEVFFTEGNRNIGAAWIGDGGDRQWSFSEFALGFAVSPSDPDRVMMTDLGCAHLSTDGGKTWRQVYSAPAKPRQPGDPIVAGEPYSSNGLEVTSTWEVAWFDQSTLFAGYSDIRAARSADGGKTWGFDYTGVDLNTVYRSVRHPKTGVCYAAASTTHDIYQSSFLADNAIDIGKGRVLFSTDLGKTWQVLHDFGMPVVWVALDSGHANRLYACVANRAHGGIYVTDSLDRNGQSEWVKLAAPPRTEGHPLDLYVLDDGTLVCTYSGRRTREGFMPSSGVFVSRDEGKTWEDRTDPRMRYWTKDLELDPHDAAQRTWYVGVCHAWAGAQGGASGLYRTRDRGLTWDLIADSRLSPTGVLNVESCALDPAHPGEAYLATEYDGLYYTGDITAKHPVFQPLAAFLFRHPTRIRFNPYDPAEIWVTTFGHGLQVSERGGQG